MGNQPEKKFVHGAISATVWVNEGKDNQGNATEFRTISLQRSYTDQQGNWQNTSTLRMNDVPKAMCVLQEAYKHIGLKEDPHLQQQQQQQGQQ